MNITTHLHRLGPILEEKGLVKVTSSPSINGFTFKQIESCCSLSNQRMIGLLFNRLSVFLMTWQWLNDAKIGTHLFHEYLWITSQIANQIKHQNYAEKNRVLNRIDLINTIFEKIIMKDFRTGETHPYVVGLIPIPNTNKANPTISKMFPIRLGSAVGAALAETLAVHIKKLQTLYSQTIPHQYLLEKIEMREAVSIAHQPAKNISRRQNCWSQTVNNLLTTLLPSHISKCITTYDTNSMETAHQQDSVPFHWWNEMNDQQKIDMVCGVEITLKDVNKKYSIKGESLSPYKIRLEVSASSD